MIKTESRTKPNEKTKSAAKAPFADAGDDPSAAYATLEMARAIPYQTLSSHLSLDLIRAWIGFTGGRLTRAVAMDRLVADLQDPQREGLFVQTHRARFSIHPKDLEDRLGITSVERKRWSDAGLLVVAGEDRVRRYGRTLVVPRFDAIASAQITPEDIARWREQDAQRVSAARRSGARKATATRARNAAALGYAKERMDARRKRWLDCGDPLLAATLDLAFWTMWASRWAKVHAPRQRRRAGDQSEIWYSRKHAALARLSRSAFTTLSVAIPENPHKELIDLCDEHYDDFRDERSTFDQDFWSFIAAHKKAIRTCPNCNWITKQHHYSLYDFAVEGAGECFRFHEPAPLGRRSLPPIKQLPQTEMLCEEVWGDFRFGRALDPDEKRLYTEAMVERELAQAMDVLDALLPKTDGPVRAS